MFLKDTLKVSDDYKNKQLKCNEVMIFLICKSICILKLYSIHFILRKKSNAKKLSFVQNKHKKWTLFSYECIFKNAFPTHHSFTFHLRFLHELTHKVLLSKNLCGIFHLNFWFAFIKVYIFVQVKALAIWLQNAIIPF